MSQIPDPGEGAREPARNAGIATAVAGAAITAVVAFGVDLTPGQTAAILGLVTVLAPLLQAAWTRRQVWAPHTVGWLMRDRGPVRMLPTGGASPAWRWAFLGLTGLVLGMELWAGFDKDDRTEPWTDMIVQYVPGEVTALAIAGLFGWLAVHFGRRYWRKHKQEKEN